MGYYLNGELPTLGKANALIAYHNARFLTTAEKNDVNDAIFMVGTYHQRNEVVIVTLLNGNWEAAALAYSQQEFDRFMDPSDPRRKEIVIAQYKDIVELMENDPYTNMS